LSDCQGVSVKMTVSSGDADLYAKTESVPDISNSDCDNCPLCRSRNSHLSDECTGITTPGHDTFYLSVTAHKSYNNGRIVFSGTNLMNVTSYQG